MTKSRDLGDLAQTVAVNLPSSLGSASQVLHVNSGATALEFADAAGGGSIQLTASGALSSGDPVVVNSDGTVSVVESTAQAVGTPAVFDATNSTENSSTFDSSNNKVVVFYKNSSSYPAAKVGTVSGLSTSFGSEVVVKSATSNIYQNSAAFDSSNNKVVFAWKDNGNSGYGTAVVGTVSGTSISFGTPVVFESAASADMAVLFDSSNNKVVIGYRDQANSHYGTAIVGTVSGTSISFGSPTVFEAARIDLLSGAFDSSNNKVIFAYQDEGNSNRGTAVVGTVSGTSISFGSGQVFNTSITYETSVVFDTNANKIVIAYRDGGGSNHGTAIVGTVSGTSMTFGTSVKFEESTVENPRAVFDSNSNKVNVFFDDSGSNDLEGVAGTVSGTSISFGSAFTVSTDQPSDKGITPTFDSNSNVVNVAFSNFTQGDTYNVVFRNTSTNLTAGNFIGFSDAAYSDAATATIELVGSVNTGQSGLTAGQSYYVQTDGTLSTTADDPSVLAGIAISATGIIVKG